MEVGVNFTPRPLYPRVKLGELKSQFRSFGEEKISLYLPGIEPWTVQPVASLLYQLRYSGL